MKTTLFLLTWLLSIMPIFAQKLVPASSSAYAGIALPAGTMQDRRILSTVAAALFLEEESKKANIKILTAEVFELPPQAASGFGIENLKEALRKAGWTIIPIAGTIQYGWLQKGKRYLMFYFSGSDLYFGEPESIPDSFLANNNREPQQVDNLPAQSSNKPEQTLRPAVNTVPTNSNHGISVATTNFDDGWVANPYDDYVKITKGAITVLLHYAIELDDNLRNTGSVEGALFDRLMQPRYVVSNLRKYDNNGPCYFCIYFYEADVVEKSTGRKYYAGFRVLIESGMARCIEILAPSAQEFQKEFPNQEKIAGMLGYNKFAVTLADLVGTWEETSGAAANMYNVVTGAYAGMATASSTDTFTFNADGTYSSRHVGAHGTVGDMKVYDEKYQGKITLTHWDITMTNRWQGKTEQWWAQFEAVRGGKVLHLADKSAPAVHYALVKVK